MTDTRTSTAPATEATADALRGPWQAVLIDGDGYVIDNMSDLHPHQEVSISIRRWSALPTGPVGEQRLPGTCRSGDVIELWDYLYVEDGDPSTDAPARWAQAQAMAAGLNSATQPAEALLQEVRDWVGGHDCGEVDVWGLRELLAGRKPKL